MFLIKEDLSPDQTKTYHRYCSKLKTLQLCDTCRITATARPILLAKN